MIVNEYHLREALEMIARHRRDNPDRATDICWASACNEAGEPLLTVSHDPVTQSYGIVLHEGTPSEVIKNDNSAPSCDCAIKAAQAEVGKPHGGALS